MDRNAQLTLLNLTVDTSLRSVVVANNSKQAGHRDMLMDECLSLIAFHLSRIIWVAFEIPTLQDLPIDVVQLTEITVVARPIRIGMSVGEHKPQVKRPGMVQAGDKNHDFFVASLLHTPNCSASHAL